MTDPKGRGRKTGSKDGRERRTSFKVDKFRESMDAEALEEFDNWVGKFRPSNTDIWNRLREQGYTGTLGSVQNWYCKTFPIGEQARELNALAAEAKGIDTFSSMELSMARLLNVFKQIQQRIEQNPELAGVSMLDVLRMLPVYSREVRAHASDIQNFTVLTERRELEMAGAYAVVEELLLIFENDPAYEAISTACKAAISKLEER
jgi:hypothetical protein